MGLVWSVMMGDGEGCVWEEGKGMGTYRMVGWLLRL